MGMVATPAGKLYVANSGDSNVLVYRTTRRGPQGPVATPQRRRRSSGQRRRHSQRRVVAVSNGSTGGSGAGSVSVYLNRQSTAVAQPDLRKRPRPRRRHRHRFERKLLLELQRPGDAHRIDRRVLALQRNGDPLVSGLLKAGGLAFDRNRKSLLRRSGSRNLQVQRHLVVRALYAGRMSRLPRRARKRQLRQ